MHGDVIPVTCDLDAIQKFRHFSNGLLLNNKMVQKLKNNRDDAISDLYF